MTNKKKFKIIGYDVKPFEQIIHFHNVTKISPLKRRNKTISDSSSSLKSGLRPG